MSSVSNWTDAEVWTRLESILNTNPHEESRAIVRTWLQERQAVGLKPLDPGHPREHATRLLPAPGRARHQRGDARGRHRLRELCTDATKAADDKIASIPKGNASKEVEFLYALRGGDLDHAANVARSITDSAGVHGLALHRAWWAYQTASTYEAMHARSKNNEHLQLAKKFGWQWSAVDYHLHLLRQAGFVVRRKGARCNSYELYLNGQAPA